MEDAAAGVVPTAIGKGGTPVVPLGAVAVDEPTLEVEVAVAAAGGVEAVDAGPETATLALSYSTIPRPPLPPWRTACPAHVDKLASEEEGSGGDPSRTENCRRTPSASERSRQIS